MVTPGFQALRAQLRETPPYDIREKRSTVANEVAPDNKSCCLHRAGPDVSSTHRDVRERALHIDGKYGALRTRQKA